jgi:hypothetical protein
VHGVGGEDIVRVRVADAMRADAFHEATIGPVVLGECSHVVVGAFVDRAHVADARGVHTDEELFGVLQLRNEWTVVAHGRASVKFSWRRCHPALNDAQMIPGGMDGCAVPKSVTVTWSGLSAQLCSTNRNSPSLGVSSSQVLVLGSR